MIGFYDHTHRDLGHYTESVPEESPEGTSSHINHTIGEVLSGRIENKFNFEETTSQNSTQRQKRRTHKEACLHHQQLEQDQIAKRQRRNNDQVNSETQRLQQAEHCQAKCNQERNHKSHFFWNETSTKQLLEMMRELQMDYLNMDATTSGFIPWSHFFKTNENQKVTYDLLKNLSFDTLERRYKIYDFLKLMNTNSSGMNSIGLDLGDFCLSTNQQDIEQGGKETNPQGDKTNLGQGDKNSNSENEETIIRMENDSNNHEQGTETQERVALDTRANLLESSRRVF
ncbi:hypothetical protein O181_084557 [Austropuccinia psidii MF-1]|uniref:Uncharacterized protein n=1 Tax=Austropuccinia psidii MF-1 TaxID=1389203 RepID=A0A9Q3IL27_9BASI|nr:hypothetical protein [Austropuccinia psidii MF-1]